MRVSVLPVLLVAVACGGDTGPGKVTITLGKTVDIFTVGDTFSPTFASIAAGDTIRWNFSGGSDGQGHNVRFTPAVQGAPADINVHKTGTALSIFTTRGDFHYVCDVHPGMLGEVVVQ